MFSLTQKHILYGVVNLKGSFLTTLRDNIATVINRENDKTLADIDKRLEELQTELLKLATSKYDEQLVRRLIEKFTIYEDKFTVEFKSGVTVDVNE